MAPLQAGATDQRLRPIRICFVVTGLGTGGAEMMLLKLLSRLDRNDFETLVISLADGGALRSKFESQCGRVVSLGMVARGIQPSALRTLAISLRDFRPDLIQGWMYHGNLMALLGRFFLAERVPVLWNVRGMSAVHADNRWRSTLVYRISGWMSGFAERIVNNSSASAAAHEELLGFPLAARVIIPNGFDTEVFAPRVEGKARVKAELGLPANSVVIGLVGRYHPDKDVPNFLEAAKHALARDSRLHFVLVGNNLDHGNGDLGKLILKTGVPEMFHPLGQRDDIPDVFAMMDIVVSASRSENFPNAIGEAMSCAIPCVVTGVGDCGALVGNTGRIVPPRNPELLGAAITDLVEMGAAARAALGSEARQRIVERYSLESVVRRYEDLYRRVHAEARRG